MAWFDATTIDPAVGSSNFPIGRHPVVIKGSTVTPTKDQTGGMLVFTCEIIDGPHKGVSGLYRLNLWNSNTQAAEIAAKQLSAICHVVGTFQLNAEPKGAELFGKPFFVIVEKQKENDYTQIVAVQDIQGNAPVKGQGPSAPQQQAPMQQPPMQQANPAAPPAWSAPQVASVAQVAPAAQPAWSAPQQAPAQQTPAQQPAWSAPAQPAAAPAQPAWSQAPAAGAQPAWSMPR